LDEFTHNENFFVDNIRHFSNLPSMISQTAIPIPADLGAVVPPARAPLRWALSVFAFGLVTTLAAWSSAHQEQQHLRQAEFDFQARQMTRRIAQRMGTYEQVQRGVQAHLLGSMDVQRDDFRRFVAALRLDDKFPGIQAVALVPLFSAAQLARHEAQMR
jgi:CHASE1-domain containing sensor protein